MAFDETIPDTLHEGTYKVCLIEASGAVVGLHDNVHITAASGVAGMTAHAGIRIINGILQAPGAVEMRLYSADGRLMAQGTDHVSTGNLQTGAYAVRVAYANDIATFKFVK